jgi:hypothetical protein
MSIGHSFAEIMRDMTLQTTRMSAGAVKIKIKIAPKSF